MKISYKDNIQRVFSDPKSLRGELLKAGIKLHRWAGTYYGPSDPISIMEEEWDNLLILDACRYDMFQDYHSFSGSLRKVHSAGSQSREFMEHNFVGRELHDTVYVTSNPFTATLNNDIFHSVVDLFDSAWDEEVMTVRPKSVANAAAEAHERYPNKRIIAHFMQPHYPFLGETGRQLDSGGVTGQTVREVGKTEDDVTSIWKQLDAGDRSVDSSTVWKAYVENFKLVEEHAKTLVEDFDGKTVITADHGNLFGARLWPIPMKKYGHPPGLRFAELIDVPWHEVPFEERRTIRTDPPEESKSVEDDVVEQRLKDLGYA